MFELATTSRRRRASIAACALSLFFFGFCGTVKAQLPVGGYLGPNPFEELLREAIERQLEERAEDATEQNIQEDIQENIEETIEQTVDATVESTVEETVAEATEEAIEEQVADAAEAGVEEAIEDGVTEAVEESTEQRVAEATESRVEEQAEALIADTAEAAAAEQAETGAEELLAAALEARIDNEIEDIIDGVETELEVDESRILQQQWLVMAEDEALEELAQEGFLFSAVTALPGLGFSLAEVAAPSTFDINAVRRGVIDVVGERARVDRNHIYTAGALSAPGPDGVLPSESMVMPADLAELPLRVGMIDSAVDRNHPALSGSRIETRAFVPDAAEQPDFHGTAIASILAGSGPDYRGLAPRAELYAASVFQHDPERGEIASTVSLIRALDWLISSEVEVVNISLAGPPNRLLEAAIDRAAERNILVVAAAGNGGPVAAPMYPAAYDSVVAVTAVDKGRRVFRLANRGEYLALAAPGVDLRHAKAGGGYVVSSGTSFAVPFVTAAAARLRALAPDADTLRQLLASAQDLGEPGKDTVYGYGLLTLASL